MSSKSNINKAKDLVHRALSLLDKSEERYTKLIIVVLKFYFLVEECFSETIYLFV